MKAARNLFVSRFFKDSIDSLSKKLGRPMEVVKSHSETIRPLLNRTGETLSFGFRAILID